MFDDLLCDTYDEMIPNDSISLGCKVPWENNTQFNYMEDWDHDGIPNYADHYFGSGAEPPSLGGLENASKSIHIAYGDENALEINDDIIHIGTDDSDNWYMQVENNSCAIVAQKSVAESLGIPLKDEVEICNIVEKEGLYDPEIGTKPENVGKILESVGVEVERNYGNSIGDIENALLGGEKIIVAVNANEIWHPYHDNNDIPQQQDIKGHAVVITGIEEDLQTGNKYIILNDSGIPDGANSRIQLDDFLNAWNDFDNFAMITKLNINGGDENV